MYKVTEINSVKTYNLSAGKSTQQFLAEAERNHKSLRYNEEYKRRIELIQDFSFPIATAQVEITPDQRYIVAAGIYGPQLKIFDTRELSLKCMRGIDSEVVRFCVLSDDYSKIAMAQMDRSIDFHAQYGAHYKTRIPHQPRDLAYNPINANLCISASVNEVYRLSLEEGKFLVPFHTNSVINSLNVNRHLNVLCCGGDNLQMWDHRERKRVCTLQSSVPISYVTTEKTTGLKVAIGEGSMVSIYDVRFDRKLLELHSSYDEPINCIEFLPNNDSNIVFSNSKQIKVVNSDGSLFTAVQPDPRINMFRVCPNTGLILTALQEPKIGCFFIPELGPAPKWVPYIDTITEQLEETQTRFVFDEYKFVTKQQVIDLGCEYMLGTKLLRQYMHGYLMHLKLYSKIELQAEELATTHADKQAKYAREKIQEELPKRIEDAEQGQEATPQVDKVDSRFLKALSKPQFAVDPYSDDYMNKHPHMKKGLLKEKDDAEKKIMRDMRVSKKIRKGRNNL